MNFIKKFKGTIIAIGISAIALAISFYYPNSQYINTDVQINEAVIEDELEEISEQDETSDQQETLDQEETSNQQQIEVKESITSATVAPEEMLKPDAEIEIQEESIEKNTLSCFLTVRCDTILDNMDSIAPEKIPLVPQSGLILPEIELEFSEGESVFDVLKRELRKRNIHFEFNKVPMYDSVYIEGIGNLYEFDVGDLSGWIYRVNGNVSSVGCSQYKIKNGDKIEFLYTCNMGRDL